MTPDSGHTFEPGLVHFVGEVNAVGGLGAVFQGNLHEADGVGGIGGAHHDDQVGLRGNLLDGHLAVGGGVADVVAGRILQRREALLQQPDRFHRFIHAQRGLRKPDDLFRVPDRHFVHFVRAVDDLDVLGGFTGGSFNFLVAVVADQEDVEVVLGKADSFPVHLGHQRAGGVNGAKATVLGRLHYRGRYAVGRKNHQGAFGDLVGLVNEDGTLFLEGADHVNVVDDLLADVDRRTVVFQRLLNGNNGTVHSGAVAAGSREQNLFGA